MHRMVTEKPSPWLTRALDMIMPTPASLAHHDARRAALDDAVLAIAQQLHRASHLIRYEVPREWQHLSMEAQGVFLREAQAMVAARSAVMRLRAKATTLDRVASHIEAASDDIVTGNDEYLTQQAASKAIEEYPRALVQEYEAGR